MTRNILIAAILFLQAQSCSSHPDIGAEKKAILILLDEERTAHLEKNVSLLVGESAPGFLEINRGLIRKPNGVESMKRFQSYFDAVDFVKWDDVSDPVINFSDDATMATVVVDKLVITKQKLEANRLDTTRYAWLAVYKKYGGKWKLWQMASTGR